MNFKKLIPSVIIAGLVSYTLWDAFQKPNPQEIQQVNQNISNYQDIYGFEGVIGGNKVKSFTQQTKEGNLVHTLKVVNENAIGYDKSLSEMCDLKARIHLYEDFDNDLDVDKKTIYEVNLFSDTLKSFWSSPRDSVVMKYVKKEFKGWLKKIRRAKEKN